MTTSHQPDRSGPCVACGRPVAEHFNARNEWVSCRTLAARDLVRGWTPVDQQAVPTPMPNRLRLGEELPGACTPRQRELNEIVRTIYRDAQRLVEVYQQHADRDLLKLNRARLTACESLDNLEAWFDEEDA